MDRKRNSSGRQVIYSYDHLQLTFARIAIRWKWIKIAAPSRHTNLSYVTTNDHYTINKSCAVFFFFILCVGTCQSHCKRESIIISVAVQRILDRIQRIGAIAHQEMKGDTCNKKNIEKSIPFSGPLTIFHIQFIHKNGNALTLCSMMSRIWWTIVIQWQSVDRILPQSRLHQFKNNNSHLVRAAIMQSTNWQIDFECKVNCVSRIRATR